MSFRRTLVRLKRRRRQFARDPCRFQTNSREVEANTTVARLEPLIGFRRTLVRLKHPEPAPEHAVLRRFRRTLVRLKR